MVGSMRFTGPRLDDLYLTAGDRLYAIGSQDGRFPAVGDHVAGEMGGIWAHPIKLADAFDLRINGAPLPPAGKFTVGPYWSAFEYSVTESISVERRQFVPDGEQALVVSYRIRSDRPRDLDVAFCLACDVRPVWLEEPDGGAGDDLRAWYDDQLGAWHCRDERGDRHVLVGASDLIPEARSVDSASAAQAISQGHGLVVDLEYRLPVRSDVTVRFIIVGGAGEASTYRDVFRRVAAGVPDLERAKATRYASMIDRSRLSVPDTLIQRAWDWLKCNNDWLIRDVTGVGRGIGAGAPEYVWWFGCDTAYAVPSLLALGQADVAKDTLDLLRTLSCTGGEGSGRVIHEVTTTGRVANPGCTEETAQFTVAVNEVVLWTGDRAFLDRNYEFCRRGVLEWVLGTMDPECKRMPSGYGIVEIEGLNLYCLDVLVHTIAALDALGHLAAIVGDAETITRCAELAPILRSRLESEFWVETAGMYADVVGSSREMMPRLRQWRRQREGADAGELLTVLDDSIKRAKSDGEPDRLRPWILGNWTAVCPLDAGLANMDRAGRVLERLERPDYSRRWGMAVNGFDRDSIVMTIPTGVLAADRDSIVMTIPTGVLAAAEAAYGRLGRAVRYMRTVAETLTWGMPGAISEISPDQGCFVQAWSAYALTQPLLRHMFGFRPDALRRRIEVAPSFPPDWDTVALRNVPIGGTTCNLVWERGHLTVTVADAGWDITTDGRAEVEADYRGREYRDG